jgi:anaerobic selenocysteine-containing dehydrogenase
MYGSSFSRWCRTSCGYKCFLLVGMDPVQSAFVWLESVPGSWHRVLDAQSRGAEIIVVDPRLSQTAERGRALSPGQD